ncbi:MAG: hypothetical protein HY860_02465 [Chlamydiales bacterium]|nr:hypothetical protein [Chlamydiales bacterium]
MFKPQLQEESQEQILLCKNTETEITAQAKGDSEGTVEVEASIKQSRECPNGSSYTFELKGEGAHNKDGKNTGTVTAKVTVKL